MRYTRYNYKKSKNNDLFRFILKLVGTVVGAGICGITLAYVAYSILTKNNELPSGINSKSTEIEGLVESSTNLGVLTTTEGFVEYDSAVRSSVSSLKEEIVLRSKTIVNLLGGELECNSGYPAWEYNSNSKIREICQSVHKEMYGKEAEIVAIHAGVECGLFNEKLGNLDMISFGPNLYDVHTPEEHMSISSVKNCYEYLVEILKSIK